MAHDTSAFDRQPILEGERLRLRPLCASDFDALFAAAADPLLWAQHPATNRHEGPVFQRFFDEALASGGALVAIDLSNDTIIGTSRFHAYDAAQSQIEIGWTFLARSHWGGTYNGEMKRLMIEHAFRFVRHVIFVVAKDNLRSQRAVAKLGALPAGKNIDERGLERVVYRLTAMTSL